MENTKENSTGFIKEHFEIIVIAVMMIGAFMVSRSDLIMINESIRSIDKEMKDFHGRLCTLEERYLQILSKKEKSPTE